MSISVFGISSDKKMNGKPLSMTVASSYSGGTIAGYNLTEAEKLQVAALNEMRGVAHLVRERNENPHSSGGRHE